MKTSILLLILISSSLAFGTIRRVNNNPGIILVPDLVYASFSTAIADAIDGDTIYLEPSSILYPSANISKRIVFIGNGYQLESNKSLITPISSNKLESVLTNSFSFMVGSSNSKVFGIVFNFGFTINSDVSGIEISGCKLTAGITISGDNNILQNCISGMGHNISGSGLNNLIQSSIIGQSQISNAIINHCYIDNLLSGTNTVFNNCIIETVNASLSSTNTIAFCLKIPNGVSVFPESGINNNVENLSDRTTIFIVDDPSIQSLSNNDKNYKLKMGSPALAAGTNGSDIGPFGGLSPYKLSGQAPIPIITNFFITNTGSVSSGLVGSITIQSNN
jgi:hypothetical protein